MLVDGENVHQILIKLNAFYGRSEEKCFVEELLARLAPNTPARWALPLTIENL